jgi:hypothetical protein
MEGDEGQLTNELGIPVDAAGEEGLSDLLAQV